MKKWGILILTLLLVSCNRSGSSPDVRTAIPYIYAGDGLSGKYIGYSVDPKTGLLSLLPISPFSICAAACPYPAFDYSRNLFFVADGTKTYLAMVDPGSGRLTTIASVSNGANQVAVFPSYSVVIAVTAVGSLYVYSYQGLTFSQLFGSPYTFPNGAAGGGLIPDPLGRFLYFAISGSTSFKVLPINSSGFLSQVNPTTNTSTLSSAIDSTGSALFLSQFGSIATYALHSDGTVTAGPTATPPIESDTVTLDPTGRILISVNSTTPSVDTYSVNVQGPSLTYLTSTSSVTNLSGGSVIDPSGQYLYLGQSVGGNKGFYVYSINRTTGVLTSIQSPVLSGYSIFSPSWYTAYK